MDRQTCVKSVKIVVTVSAVFKISMVYIASPHSPKQY